MLARCIFLLPDSDCTQVNSVMAPVNNEIPVMSSESSAAHLMADF